MSRLTTAPPCIIVNPEARVRGDADTYVLSLPRLGIEVAGGEGLRRIIDYFAEPATEAGFRGCYPGEYPIERLKALGVLIEESEAGFMRAGLLKTAPALVAHSLHWSHIHDVAAGTPCLIGAPCDYAQVSLFSPRTGPGAIRRALYLQLSGHPPPRFVDLGDIVYNPNEGRECFDARLRKVVEMVIASGGFPLVLGGDHSITLPLVTALAPVYPKLRIIHFDAHDDLGCINVVTGEAGELTHANVMRLIVQRFGEMQLIQAGVRRRLEGPVAAPGIVTHYGAVDDGTVETLLNTVQDGAPCYLSIDMDVLDPAYAHEVTTPVAGGTPTDTLLAALSRIARSARVVGVDIVEVCETGGRENRAAAAAASLILTSLAGASRAHA